MKIIIFSKKEILVDELLIDKLKGLKKQKRLTKYIDLDEFGNIQTLGDVVYISSEVQKNYFSKEINII